MGRSGLAPQAATRGGAPTHVLGVDYVHTVTAQGGDLYLTPAGCAKAEHLQPENWYEPSWFRTHREELRGTGAVYAVPTRPVDGESLGLVVKFSRVGERVPIDTKLIEDLLCCEFNGPFEEFALVEDLRRLGSAPGRDGDPVRTQVPLAIYVPPGRMQPSQSGRFQWRIDRAVARHPGVAIDILREYIMVYSWLPGVDASEASEMGLLERHEVVELTARATAALDAKGFNMLDMKPAHLIVQLAGPTELVRREGQIDHAVVDYELMERTPEYEHEVKQRRREAFAHRQRRMREQPASEIRLPPNLHAARILGIDFVEGRVESTGGNLWVVGQDPELFDLFLPERWRTTPQVALPQASEAHFTESKDNIRLVWIVSSVGERPNIAIHGAAGFRLLYHGHNSPFEEVAFSRWLRTRGIPTILPLAIYRTGPLSLLNESPFDTSRYRTHEHLRAADGTPILQMRHNYIALWEHWHGPEPGADQEGSSPAEVFDAGQALEQGWLTRDESAALIEEFEGRMLEAGVEALGLLPSQLLVTRHTDGGLRRDERGRIAARLCRLSFLRWLAPGPAGAER
jgi:hypothetical protein